jgi:hypothetical protein
MCGNCVCVLREVGRRGGRGNACPETSIAELENARALHGETNMHIGLHRPAHRPFATYGS